MTCMRVRHLEALEDDRFDDLPGRAYAKAFLRSYATSLGLDGDRFVAEFDEQVPEPEEAHDPVAPPRRFGRVPLRAAPGAAVIAIAGLLVWGAWSNDHVGGGSPVTPPAAESAAAAPVVHHVAHVKAATKTVRVPQVLVVRAVRGPCWVQARRGGPSGAILAERTLPAGAILRLPARQVWLRLGAPWNVRVQRGDRTVELPPGTRPVDIVD